MNKILYFLYEIKIFRLSMKPERTGMTYPAEFCVKTVFRRPPFLPDAE